MSEGIRDWAEVSIVCVCVGYAALRVLAPARDPLAPSWESFLGVGGVFSCAAGMLVDSWRLLAAPVAFGILTSAVGDSDVGGIGRFGVFLLALAVGLLFCRSHGQRHLCPSRPWEAVMRRVCVTVAATVMAFGVIGVVSAKEGQIQRVPT